MRRFDPTTLSGRLIRLGEVSEAVRPDAAPGSGDSMYTWKAHETREGVVSDDQPEAREGQAGRPGVAERFVSTAEAG